MSPSFTLETLTPADVPDMATAYNDAFASDPIGVVALPKSIDPADRERWLLKRLALPFRQEGIAHWGMRDEFGKVIAWCRWEFPRVLTAEEEEAEKKWEEENKVELPEGANTALWESMMNEIGAMKKKYIDRSCMHSVHFLVVSTPYQRLGLGSRLLRHGLEIADAQKQKVYIEATKVGQPLYLKLGWRNVDAVVQEDMKKFGGSGFAGHQIMVSEVCGKASDSEGIRSLWDLRVEE